MLKNTQRYHHYLVFKNAKDKNYIPSSIFWIAIITIYIVTNAPRNRIIIAIDYILRHIPCDNSLWAKTLLERFDYHTFSELLANLVFVPLKGFLFFVAFLVLISPIFRAIKREKALFYKLGIRKLLITSAVIFVILALFVFPYRYPLGTGSMGFEYAIHSSEPFAQDAGWYYRRILMPALAYFIQMDSPIFYYLFSLFCTYSLILMSVSFIESKIVGLNKRNDSTIKQYSLKDHNLKLIYYLSIATSSYILHNFQFPGYTEQLAFILLLVAACIPMTSQERLATAALSLATHEVSFFVFLPIVFFCFPRREILNYIYLVVLYFIMWLAGNGFSLAIAVSKQALVGGVSGLDYWLKTPVLGLAGLFFSYKLLWFIVLYVLGKLWLNGEKKLVFAIVSIILFPALTSLPSVDTSRMVGMSFFGILTCFAIVINEYKNIPIKNNLLIIVVVNILCPSYNVLLHRGFQSYPGLYRLIPLIPSQYIDYVD